MTAYREPPALDPARSGASLLRLLRPYRARLVGVLGVFVIKDSSVWLLPVITSRAIDVVVDGGPLSSIGLLALSAAVLLLQVYPTHMAFVRLYMDMVRRIAVSLRNTVTAHLQSLSIGYYNRTSAAVMQSKVVRDVENIELMFAQVGNPFFSALIVFSGAVAMTALSVPQFLPVYALTIPLGASVWWAMQRRSRRPNEEFRRQMEHYSRRVNEMATLMPVTRAHALETVAYERVSAGAEQVRSRGMLLDLVNGRFAATSWVLMQLLAVGCLLGAAALTLTGLIPATPGQVVLLGTYFTTLTGTVMSVLNFLPIITKGRESLHSIAEVLAEPDLERNEGRRIVDEVVGEYRFEGVTLTFPGESSPALDGIDLVVPAGRTVAFVGSSGSGKSTLINTALGFVRPTSGRVLLDGVDLAELDLRSVRRSVSVVPQESVLFEGTIRENIAYGLGEVDDATLRDALDRANALDLVEALPDGWHTAVGVRGSRLSGGQRQRLSIARALIRDPRVLVLDEATSALDAESERRIKDALETLQRGRTTFIVAHRLSTIRDADRIVVLDRGRIVQSGTHDELLAEPGRYRELWDLQFA